MQKYRIILRIMAVYMRSFNRTNASKYNCNEIKNTEFLYYYTLVCTCRSPEFLQFVKGRKNFSH